MNSTKVQTISTLGTIPMNTTHTEEADQVGRGKPGQLCAC